MMIIRHKVRDDDQWRPMFDLHVEQQKWQDSLEKDKSLGAIFRGFVQCLRGPADSRSSPKKNPCAAVKFHVDCGLPEPALEGRTLRSIDALMQFYDFRTGVPFSANSMTAASNAAE